MSLTNQNQQGSNKKGGKKAGTANTKATSTAKPPKGSQMKPKVNMVRKTGG
jgi:hypothetical protein